MSKDYRWYIRTRSKESRRAAVGWFATKKEAEQALLRSQLIGLRGIILGENERSVIYEDEVPVAVFRGHYKRRQQFCGKRAKQTLLVFDHVGEFRPNRMRKRHNA